MTDTIPRIPGPAPPSGPAEPTRPHRGVQVSGDHGEDGKKAFYIHIEALPGQEHAVIRMLEDILGCVRDEPATGPWYAVRYSQTVFGIFEVFPNLAGRQAHVEGGGGDIFRDVERMNAILACPAHVHRLDVLMGKEQFAGGTP
ncbi:putative quinol monooxygenase [Alloalcanivorax mobilis]|uniref:putative quinol monooxygenase n=1 Tax=Alloalcanivorax mobilis TaxID=2019569 RepID=UPI0018E423CD|nr:hypothetical protein [Alloalcanivorax mobilis]